MLVTDTTTNDVPSTSVSRPLPVSPAHRTSRADLVQSNVIVNQPGRTGIGEHFGHAPCIDRHQPGLQIISNFDMKLAAGHQAILHRIQREEARTRSQNGI